MLPDGIQIEHPDRLYIDGAWVEPLSEGMFELISPNTQKVVAHVAQAREADMDLAVSAARKAFDDGPWAKMAPAARGKLIRAMGEQLRRREPELAAAWVAQVGGLASFAPIMVSGGTSDFLATASLCDTYAFVERRPSRMVDTALVVREPAGVVAAIAPWNAPYGIMASKVAYALVAGCTIIIKPSPETPLEAYIIAEAAQAAGIPPGVVNLVCGNREASDHLVCNAGVDKVSFTGSTVAGRRIGSVCGERIARVTLELGGKSAAIVRDDFPIEAAAAILGNTITIMSGQVCAMLSRAIVSRHRHDALAAAIKDVMQTIRIGHSEDPQTQLGPVAMKRQLERVESYIAEGCKTSDLVTGGHRPSQMSSGYFVEPTLFANVDNKSRIAQEEIFGPVLCLIPADDDEDAIRIANESNYGLNGSVLTHDVDAAYAIARRMRVGGVGQNGMRLEFSMPYGGFKQSGLGREGGPDGLSPYLETKTILLDGLPSSLEA